MHQFLQALAAVDTELHSFPFLTDFGSRHTPFTGHSRHLFLLQNSRLSLTKEDSKWGTRSSSSSKGSLNAISLAKGESSGFAFSHTGLSSRRKMLTVMGPIPLNSSSFFSRSWL